MSRATLMAISIVAFSACAFGVYLFRFSVVANTPGFVVVADRLTGAVFRCVSNLSLKDFRAKYPEYNDLDDGKLLEAIRAKFYPHIDQLAFRSLIGADDPFQINKEKQIKSGVPC